MESSGASAPSLENACDLRHRGPVVAHVAVAAVVCHAGGRGFESRRSRSRNLPAYSIFCCLVRRVQGACGQQTGSNVRWRSKTRTPARAICVGAPSFGGARIDRSSRSRVRLDNTTSGVFWSGVPSIVVVCTAHGSKNGNVSGCCCRGRETRHKPYALARHKGNGGRRHPHRAVPLN
jgi:hypothetical protein